MRFYKQKYVTSTTGIKTTWLAVKSVSIDFNDTYFKTKISFGSYIKLAKIYNIKRFERFKFDDLNNLKKGGFLTIRE